MNNNLNAAPAGRDNKVAGKMHSVVDQASSSAHNVVDKAMGAADSAAGWLNDRKQKVTATPRELMSKSTEYVAANPLKALGIAVVAGVLLSKIAF